MKRITLLAALVATPAAAHHPLGGMEMSTFGHGLLSGVGHPVLGFDHLLFVALVGVAAALVGRAATAPAAYLAAMIAGVALAAGGLTLPLAEAVIAVSLLALGGVVLSGHRPQLGVTLALFAGFGLFHGTAFGGAMASAEAGSGAAVLAGYLIGLAAIQYAIARASGWVATRAWGADAAALGPRLTGALVAGAGLLLTLETVEGAAFAALGWG